MNKNFLKLWAFALAAVLAFTTSCKDDDDPILQIPSDFSEVKFDGAELTKTVKFNSNQAWSAEVLETRATDVSWLDVSPKSGEAGDATITLTAEESFSLEERTAYVHIIINGLSKSIEVKQSAGILVIEDDAVKAATDARGFYVANEDWFGHDVGTVNFFEKSGNSFNPQYRAYRAANEGLTLGTSTSYGAVWGENAYFVSKQGDRLVVADAKTLKNKASIENLNGIGDGRSIVGVDDKKIYVSGSSGIAVFDIENLVMGNKIDGVSGQIGNMVVSLGRVFAVYNSTLYVIDAKTDEVEKYYSGSYNTLAVSKDGDVWVAAANKLIQLNPVTLEQVEMDYPGGANINAAWGAWNASGLSASTQTNTLYWTTGGTSWGGDKKVVKYDIDTKSVDTEFFVLGESSYGTATEFYGAGMRVNPLTDELVLTSKHTGWGDAYAYNWVHVLDNNGNEKVKLELGGDNGTNGNESLGDKYYWFPAVPFFEDANKPQILINQIIVNAGQEKVIDLSEVVVDHDNSSASIIKSVSFADSQLATVTIDGDELTVKAGETAGKTVCTLSVVSNGVRVEKEVRIDIAK